MGKTLLLYFSPQGHTMHYVNLVADKLNADTHEIKAKVPYTEEDLNWTIPTTRATVEQKTMHDGRVDILNDLPDTSKYDTVILAHPIWWGIPPRLIATTIDKLDLNNKILAMFATSDGSNYDWSQSNIERTVKENNYQNVAVKKGIVFNNDNQVDDWVKENDLNR